MTIARPRVSRLLVVLVGAATVAGCGSGSGKKNYADAAFPGSGGTVGGGGAGHPGLGGTTAPGSGGATVGTGGTASDAGVVNPDAPVAPTNTLLVPGITALIGPGLPCSQTTVAAGAVAPDRWCGIAMAASTTATTISLAVFNVTKAMAGTPITCTATDPNCLTLSTAIAVSGDAAHGFFGQTLIYYDDAGVYAWRPGWTAGRKLIARSSTLLAHCEASATDVTTALCYQQDTATTDAPFMGFAGTIDTPTGPVLPLFEAAIGSSLRFSPDSLSVIWSVHTDDTTPAEALKMKKIGDSSAAVNVATNVTSWSLSADGKSWLWFSAPVIDAKTKLLLGTLQSAPYPAGTAPVSLQTKTYDYVPFGTKGVTVLANPTANGTDLKSFPDLSAAAPMGTVLEAADTFGIVDIDAKGTVMFFNDTFDLDAAGDNFLVNLRVVKADGTGKCAVTVDPAADPSASLTRSGTGVAWGQVTLDASNAITAVTGNITTLADCMPHAFSSAISAMADVSTGLIYAENYNPDAVTADLSYALFGSTGTLNPKMQIQKEADLGFEALFPELPRVLFSLHGRPTGNGIYVSPALTGVPTAASVAPTQTTVMLPASQRGLAQTPHLRASSGRQASLGRASLASRLGLSSAAPDRPVQGLRAFGNRMGRVPFLRPSGKVSRQ